VTEPPFFHLRWYQNFKSTR